MTMNFPNKNGKLKKNVDHTRGIQNNKDGGTVRRVKARQSAGPFSEVNVEEFDMAS